MYMSIIFEHKIYGKSLSFPPEDTKNPMQSIGLSLSAIQPLKNGCPHFNDQCFIKSTIASGMLASS